MQDVLVRFKNKVVPAFSEFINYTNSASSVQYLLEKAQSPYCIC